MDTINDRMEMLVNQKFDGNKAAFAKALDMSPTMMSSYLGNKRRSKPSVDMVTKIVTKLGVDARWLLTGEEPSPISTVETRGDFSPASMNGNVSVASDAVLAERVNSLERLVEEKDKLIEEKERTIKILMEK